MFVPITTQNQFTSSQSLFAIHVNGPYSRSNALSLYYNSNALLLLDLPHLSTLRSPTLRWFGHATRRPEGELIKDLLLPTLPRTWRRRAGGQLTKWATTIKADLELISGPRLFGHARWRKDWVEVWSELAQDRRAWSASVRDMVLAVGDAGSSRPRWMPTQVQVSATLILLNSPLHSEVTLFQRSNSSSHNSALG